MKLDFKKQEDFYRINFSDKEIHKTEHKRNMKIHTDSQERVVAIDFYPQTNK